MSKKYISLTGLQTYTDKLKSGTVTKSIFGLNIWSTPSTGITHSNSFYMNSAVLNLSTSTSSRVGGVKLGYTTSGKNYALKADSNGNAYVNVPWADTTIGTNYTASGKNYALKTDSNGNGYVNVPWTDTKYTLSAATSSALGGVKVGYTTSGKNYALKVDGSGNGYVNVPWTDTTYTLSAATSSALGGIKIGYTQSGKNYPVQLDSSNKAFVSVDTIGTGYTTSGKNYALKTDINGNGYVNVPWTDTKYTLPTASTTVKGGVRCNYSNSANRRYIKLSMAGEDAFIDSAMPITAHTSYPEETFALQPDVATYVDFAGGTPPGIGKINVTGFIPSPEGTTGITKYILIIRTRKLGTSTTKVKLTINSIANTASSPSQTLPVIYYSPAPTRYEAGYSSAIFELDGGSMYMFEFTRCTITTSTTEIPTICLTCSWKTYTNPSQAGADAT